MSLEGWEESGKDRRATGEGGGVSSAAESAGVEAKRQETKQQGTVTTHSESQKLIVEDKRQGRTRNAEEQAALPHGFREPASAHFALTFWL